MGCRKIALTAALAGAAWGACAAAAEYAAFPADALRLVQEIDCAQPEPAVPFEEFPDGASRVEAALGAGCRTLPPDDQPAYFAYRLGQGKGLKAGAAYMLAVEYPEDGPRAFFVHNWGCDTISGFATGRASGDVVVARYVHHNPESLDYPLSGKMEHWTGLFFLHDRFPNVDRARDNPARPLTPEDGFWVVISRAEKNKDPLSRGPAVRAIRLYEVADPAKLALPLNPPPAGLPRRRMFWREEMSDGVVAMGHKPEEKDPRRRGLDDVIDWYDMKFKFMQFIGYDTYCTDLLEFGHNQGWDSSKHGGNDWIYQAPNPDKWHRLLERMKPYGFAVVPYYEWSGSVGGGKAYGPKRRAERPDQSKRKDYTQIHWTEKANADLTDPDALADLRMIFDITIGDERGVAPFAGAWLRPRPSFNPVGFSDATRARFAQDANGGQAVAREQLLKDAKLMERYYAWWFDRRRDFLVGARDAVREYAANPDAFVLYTTDTSEPGQSIGQKYLGEGKKDAWKYKSAVVTDDVAGWKKITDGDFYQKKFFHPLAFNEAVGKDLHHKALLDWAGTWGDWDWTHSCPPPDPQRYKDVDGVMMTYTMHRLYSVGHSAGMDAFRAKSGLAAVRHLGLNENELVAKDAAGKDFEPTGYFVADVERAGPYCMAVEARAVATGDPDHIAYLYGNSIQRGFPYYARRFNQAFQALPALPSTVAKGASADPDVVVREIRTPNHGVWYAVVNNGFAPKQGVAVTLPAKGRVTDAAAGAAVDAPSGRLALDLYPFELRALRVQ